MHRTWTILSSLVVVVSAVAALGCSSSTAAPGDGGGGGGGPVSFSNDVMPIFQMGCTLSGACHGQVGNAAEENLYLGDNLMNTPAIIAQVYAGLVGVPALEDPAMSLIAKGDISKSYLSHKLMNDQNNFASDCAKAPLCPQQSCTPTTPCGAFMPYLGSVDLNRAAIINNWITQGAMQN
jgi:hypothetical protein